MLQSNVCKKKRKGQWTSSCLGPQNGLDCCGGYLRLDQSEQRCARTSLSTNFKTALSFVRYELRIIPRRWQIREAKAAEEAAAKEKAPGQKGATLLSFFSKAPVCAPQQSQQQGDDSNDVLCLDDVGSGEGDRDVGGGDCTPLSPSSAGGGLDMSDVAGHDDEQPAADLSSSACPGFEPEIGYPAVQGYPFGMHSKAGIRIPWKLELYGPGLRLRAVEEDGRRGCTGRASPCGGPCERCASLEFYPKVTGEHES